MTPEEAIEELSIIAQAVFSHEESTLTTGKRGLWVGLWVAREMMPLIYQNSIIY